MPDATDETTPGDLQRSHDIEADLRFKAEVLEALVEHIKAKTLPELGDQVLADSRFWFGNHDDDDLWREAVHFALGIGGESGEVLDVIKKADVCGGFMPSCDKHADGKHSIESLGAEMADLLIYLVGMAALLGVDLEAEYARKRAVNIERWGDPDAED